MNELVITDQSKLDYKLFKLFKQSCNPSRSDNWLPFIKSLDPKIISVSRSIWGTHIEFEGEEYKTWFILRWS
jgi:hypothetical protein